MILSLSTRWHSHRYEHGRGLALEAKALGFSHLGLSPIMSEAQLPTLLEGIALGDAAVSHVELGCPTALDLQPGARAVNLSHARASIDLAKQIHAPHVVLRFASADPTPRTDALVAMAAAGQVYSRPYIAAKLALVAARPAMNHPALNEIMTHAETSGVRIAIAMSARFEDGPSERELHELLAAHPALGVWHDFGAVQCLANLGFLNHEEHLRSVAPRVVGADLHDVAWPANAFELPGVEHGIDFTRLLPLLPKDITCALQLRSNIRRAQVEAYRQSWV